MLMVCNLSAQKCSDYLIYDLADQISSYGIDTTGSWWILTQPYSSEYRYIINTEEYPSFKAVWPIKFSSDGENWVFAARDNINYYIITRDTIITFYTQDYFDYGFNQNGLIVYWVYSNGIETEIHFNNRVVKTLNYQGQIYINPKGDKYAAILKRGNSFVITTENFETDYFDDIKPLGFFIDDSFLYAGRKGKHWQIFRDKKPISELLENIIDGKINKNGTSAAFLARNTVNEALCILISNEFSDFAISTPYNNVSYLALHPSEPLVAYLAEKNGSYYIVYGSTEFNLGNFQAFPFFSTDGSELLFYYCNIECYLFINGQRYSVPSGLLSKPTIMRKPKTTTFCISSSTGIIMYDYFSGTQYTGTLVDEMSEPVYVTRDGSYQALGRIGNKIYLLTCKP